MTAGSASGAGAVRLQKYLSRAGVASRRRGERLIAEGRVSVDGTVVTELGTRVVIGEQVVRVDGRRVDLRPERWIAMYKPAGYLTTRKDDRERPTVYSLLPGEVEDLFHVGRLDRLSEGLLLLTNDGETAHRLLHPSQQIARRYRVEVSGEASAADAARLRTGIALDDGIARAEDVSIKRLARAKRDGRAAKSRVCLTLRQGRKREVRRMMTALGLDVIRLVRVSFGPVKLGGLEPAGWRDLTGYEVKALHEAIRAKDEHGDS